MQGKFLRGLALFLLLTLAASSAQAQPDNTYNFNPGRPGFAYGSTPLIQHTLSVEAFANVSGQTGKPWNQSGYLVNGYVLRYSPLKNLELGIGTGLAKDWSQKGVSLNPLYLVSRINILRKGDNGKPGLALIGQLNFPAGCHSQYAVSQGVIPAATLSVDQSFNNLWVVYNVGADWNAIESNRGICRRPRLDIRRLRRSGRQHACPQRPSRKHLLLPFRRRLLPDRMLQGRPIGRNPPARPPCHGSRNRLVLRHPAEKATLTMPAGGSLPILRDKSGISNAPADNPDADKDTTRQAANEQRQIDKAFPRKKLAHAPGRSE